MIHLRFEQYLTTWSFSVVLSCCSRPGWLAPCGSRDYNNPAKIPLPLLGSPLPRFTPQPKAVTNNQDGR